MSVTARGNATRTRSRHEDVPPRAADAALPRILMGVPAAGATGGGPALHLPMLVQDLRRLGFHVDTFSYGRWAEGESTLQKILRQGSDWLRFPARVRGARPDLVHLNSALDRRALLRDVPFVWLARRLGRRVVVKWHGAETRLLTQRGVWGSACRWLLGRLAALCVLSEQERRAVLAAGFTLPCHVVRNGLDLGRYAERHDVRPRLRVPETTPLLLFIARLIPTKGLRDTLEAFRRLAEEGAAHLVVIGSGPEEEPAREFCRQHDLGSRVSFLGRLTEDEARDYYCGCDILVFPTFHAEGFPMSIFQAVASGMGIVTTRIRAAADHLVEPEHALFVPAHDPVAIAAALRRLLTQPALLDAMRVANQRLAARFDRAAVARQFADIYRDLAAPPARGVAARE